MHTTLVSFIDPYTKLPLQLDETGNLCVDHGGRRQVYEAVSGCYNFVRGESAEREHYDAHYHGAAVQVLDLDDVCGKWNDDCQPWYRMLRESMGDLRGKKMLLVGAGRSSREFYFAMCGAEVTFTDLSFEGVLGSSADFRANFELLKSHSDLAGDGSRCLKSDSIQFHGADATHLPFADDCFDIVYGSAFVHHLDDWHQFFVEVHRVLRPGGICRFYDQADSRLWSFLKRTIFRPLQMYSYRRQPRSEGDIRANLRGGFNRPNLFNHMRMAGFRDLYFESRWFFLAIGLRHIGKLVHWNKRAMRTLRPIFYACRFLDAITSGFHRISDSRLALIWGFDK